MVGLGTHTEHSIWRVGSPASIIAPLMTDEVKVVSAAEPTETRVSHCLIRTYQIINRKTEQPDASQFHWLPAETAGYTVLLLVGAGGRCDKSFLRRMFQIVKLKFDCRLRFKS